MLPSHWTYSVLARSVGVVVIAAQIALGTFTNGFAQESPPLERVIADWNSRNRQFASARYRVASKVMVKRGQYSEVDANGDVDVDNVYPAQDYVFDREAMLLVDFAAEKMRWEIHGQIWNDTLRKFRPEFTVTILDGAQLSIYRPPAENTSAVYKPSSIQPELVTKSAIKDFNNAVPLYYRPILFGHGFVLPSQAKPPSQSAFLRAAAAASFIKSVDVQNVGPKEVISAQMIFPGAGTLRDEFRIEVGGGFPLVTWSVYFNNQPWQVFDITYEVTPQGSFPKQWVVSQMHKGIVANSTKFEVVSRELDVGVVSSDFEVAARPSAVVIKDGQFYKADKQGKSLERTTPAALTRELNGSSRSYPILAIALFLVVVMCVLVVRHWRNRSATQ